MQPQTASGGISWERCKRGLPNLADFSVTTGPTNLPYTTSLVASGRLQNAIICCTKWCAKLVWCNQMLHGHPRRPSLQPHWIWRHELLPIDIYRSLKNGRKCCLRRLWVNVHFVHYIRLYALFIIWLVTKGILYANLLLQRHVTFEN